MQAIQPILLGLGILLTGAARAAGPGGGRGTPASPATPDLAQLEELLRDRQHPRGQSQAALLLVQTPGPDAEKAVRRGLRQAEDANVFPALAEAVRISRDGRFSCELLAALSAGRPAVRQAAAEALAALADARLVRRLRDLAGDDKIDLAVRQAALWVLGRSGRKEAAEALVELLAAPNEALTRAAADALADLSGQNYGPDRARWQDWWRRHKDLTSEGWLEARLLYQASRAERLEGDLGRARAQLVRLHQQLYSRLPAGERLAHVQSVLEQDDPAVRLLAVGWALEMLPAADAERRRALAGALLRLSRDGAPEVGRAAVLALGRLPDPAAFERLLVLLRGGCPGVRAAAARSLPPAARANGGECQCRALAALQKALDDPAPEVVVEAAEALGALGAPEAGPVLTGLLRHSSEHVRQTAAQALERVAGPPVLDRLLAALNDPSATVRFSLVGALAHAAGDGGSLPPEQRRRLLDRLEGLLLHDGDPGVRSRAAAVLGECGTPAELSALWQCARSAENDRVEEKAWAAFVGVLARSESLPLLREWAGKLGAARQGPRRLRLLSEVAVCWQKRPQTREAARAALGALVEAQLEQGKWGSALPVVRDLLARPATEAELDQLLRWLLTVGEQALKDGNRPEARRVVQEARPFLSRSGKLADAFEQLDRQLRQDD